MAAPSYLIVGSGVFGASTALYLIRKYPDAHIALVDRNAYDAPTRVAASWDWNKIVRADYRDMVYTRLALEARALWKTDPLWQSFYHESGLYWVSKTGFAQQVLANFKELGVEADLHSYPVHEARELYGGLFADADYAGVKEVLLNKSSGWADAKEALQATVQRAVELGVKYVKAEIEALQFDHGELGGCKGVKSRAGELLIADRIILCTGAYTTKLLADSAPRRLHLHAGPRIMVAGVTAAIAHLDPDEAHIFRAMPVVIQEIPVERGASNGCVPLPEDDALKFYGQSIYSNTTEHGPTRQQMSAPPQEPDYAQWNVPEALKDDVRFAPKAIFGKKGKSLKLEQFRICWESLTPSADFIISPHAGCQNLYVATCGSFHGWKFLPVLGKYVVAMLDGELDPALEKKWAWDREIPPAENNVQWPRREFGDFW